MKKSVSISAIVSLIVATGLVNAMHIMEGFLPRQWALIWFAAAVPFVVYGLYKIQKILKENPRAMVLLAMSGAFVFVLSALKMPSVTGSCSHPTGIGLGAALFGPGVMAVLGTIVLLFQAIMLAHGGLTTLGANVFSMAIVGSIVSYFTYKAMIKSTKNVSISIFVAATLGDLLTYVTTAIQLSLAFPDPNGGFGASLAKFISIFAVTQVPIAVVEGLVTVIVFKMITEYAQEELASINFEGGNA